jgi:hypothetical protein
MEESIAMAMVAVSLISAIASLVVSIRSKLKTRSEVRDPNIHGASANNVEHVANMLQALEVVRERERLALANALDAVGKELIEARREKHLQSDAKVRAKVAEAKAMLEKIQRDRTSIEGTIAKELDLTIPNSKK